MKLKQLILTCALGAVLSACGGGGGGGGGGGVGPPIAQPMAVQWAQTSNSGWTMVQSGSLIGLTLLLQYVTNFTSFPVGTTTRTIFCSGGGTINVHTTRNSAADISVNDRIASTFSSCNEGGTLIQGTVDTQITVANSATLGHSILTSFSSSDVSSAFSLTGGINQTLALTTGAITTTAVAGLRGTFSGAATPPALANGTYVINSLTTTNTPVAGSSSAYTTTLSSSVDDGTRIVTSTSSNLLASDGYRQSSGVVALAANNSTSLARVSPMVSGANDSAIVALDSEPNGSYESSSTVLGSFYLSLF